MKINVFSEVATSRGPECVKYRDGLNPHTSSSSSPSRLVQALDYAKTIVKPCAQAQAKQRQQGHSKGFEEHAPAAKGLDTFQPDTLAVLLKRHEEEKKAAAQRVHAV